MRWSVIVVLALTAPVRAGAVAPGDPLVAARRAGDVQIDGRLDEDAWRRAPVFDGFVQLYPAEGAAPSERTEVRVLYDDRALYVGVRCLDSHPESIVRTPARRDSSTFGDHVLVVIDSSREGRTGYAFDVNAAGVQQDGIFYNDDRFSSDWDAVWDAAVSVDGEGWSAELMIPLTILPFSDGEAQTWGFGVQRTLARNHEDSATVLIRRSQRGVVSRLGTLTGLHGLHARSDLELAPYLAARVGLRPQYPYTTSPSPRLTQPSADAGLDLKATLGRGLALQATVNPDFGQVEADQIIQNLTRYELVFPEKRPFFLQGMDLFQAVPGGSGERASPQQMFYSRRVGLDAPIIAAAKLTGKASDDVQVGLLDAVVTGTGWPAGRTFATPPTGARFDGSQPLHVGAASGYAELEPATRNIFAGVWRWQPAPTAAFGLWMTSAVAPGRGCTPEEADRTNDPTDLARTDVISETLRPRRCEAPAANAAAVDVNLRSPEGEYFLRGQASASEWLGRAPMRALADGTVLRPADTGYGWYLSAGKHEGQPWRFEGQWYYSSPKLELNSVGFQRTQNEQFGRLTLDWVKPNGIGPFLSLDVQTGGEGSFTTGGPALLRSSDAWVFFNAQLRTYQSVGCVGYYDLPHWDVREIDRSGIYGNVNPPPGVPYERQGDYGGACWLSSDPAGSWAFSLQAELGRILALGPLAATTYYSLSGVVTARPQSRLETRLELKAGADHFRARWADDLAQGYLFADLRAPYVSATLRQQVVLAPTLTLQAYAQLFLSYGAYGPFYEATPYDGRIRASALHPTDAPSPTDAYDFRSMALNVNIVLRWEYRLGSTFFAVYTRAQDELGYADGSEPDTLRPHDLLRGPAVDTFMLKWSYWWSA